MLWTRRTSLQVSLLAKMLQQLLRAGSLLRDFLGMTDVCKCQNEMTALSSGSVLYVRRDRRATGYTRRNVRGATM